MNGGPVRGKCHCGLAAVLDETEYAGLCLVHLEGELASMPTADLADVPGAVLELFNLRVEYFRCD